jgi:nitrogen fixation protein FixH
MSNSKTESGFIFTGRHMLAIMVAFFGVIISVNVLMAYLANSTWSGILAKNTYVASQEFNMKAEEARKWAELGYEGTLAVDGSTITYRLKGPAEEIGRLAEIKAIFHRPVGEQQDFSMPLTRVSDGVFSAQHNLAAGSWIVDLAAIEDGKTIYHQAERIAIPE